MLVRYSRQGERVAKVLQAAGVPVDLSLSTAGTQYQPSNDSVKVLSMTGSKGLEFPVVFLPCLDSMPAASQDVATEANLLYVAMTRAMERLHMTCHAASDFVQRLQIALRAPLPPARPIL